MRIVINKWDWLMLNALAWCICFIAGVAVGRLGV